MTEILEKYQVRKSNKQKTAFIEYIRGRLKKSGYTDDDIKVEQRWKWIFKTRNIVVGDPDKASVILTAHYDTPALAPFPNFMFPTNIFMFLLMQFLLLCVLFVPPIIAMVPCMLLFEDSRIGLFVFDLLLGLICVQLMVGIRNPHTANDNTSGTCALISTLEKLPIKDREKVCVIFFDNEEKGLFGSLYASKIHKDAHNKLLINMDCVGDGDHLFFATRRKAWKTQNYASLRELCKKHTEQCGMKFVDKKSHPLMFPSDQMNFDRGIGVCTVKKSWLGLYAGRIHTPRDIICKRENIECLSNIFVEYASVVPTYVMAEGGKKKGKQR